MIYLCQCTVTSTTEKFELAQFVALMEAETPGQTEQKLKVLIEYDETLQSIRPTMTVFLDSLIEVTDMPTSGFISNYQQLFIDKTLNIGSIGSVLFDEQAGCKSLVCEEYETHVLMQRFLPNSATSSLRLRCWVLETQ